MNYNDENLKNALSSEYVLGTLKGRARVRYQRLLLERSDVRQNVWHWEKHLNTLGESLEAQKPRAEVWQNIQQRLGFIEIQKKTSKPWPTFLLPGAALAATIFFAVILFWPKPEIVEVPTKQIAIVQNAKAEALWLIQIMDDKLHIRATDNVTLHADNDYELWMLAKDGRAPVSLGLLPKTGENNLDRPTLFDQIEIAALAVSLEPLGGSPNGQPTKVLFTTELMML